MIKCVLKSIVYLFLIIFVIVSTRLFYFYNILKKCKHTTIEESYNMLDTGDIVLFRWNIGIVEDAFIQFNSLFSHCGIIVKKENQLYILENTRKGDHESFRYKGGVNLVDYIPRIKEYKGHIYMIKMKDLTECQKQIILNNTDKYLEINFQDNFTKIKNFCSCIFTNRSIFNEENIMICSEFVHRVFKDIGLINKNLYSKCTTPLNIYNMYFLDKTRFYKIK